MTVVVCEVVAVDVGVVVPVVVVVGVEVALVVVVAEVVKDDVCDVVTEVVPEVVGDVVGVDSLQFAASVPSLLACSALFNASTASSQCSSIRRMPLAVQVGSSSKSASGTYCEKNCFKPPPAGQSDPAASCTNESKNLSTS